jgi:hypothetical protein
VDTTQFRREGFAPATETPEIRSALPASKSIQSRVAAVLSVCSLFGLTASRNSPR